MSMKSKKMYIRFIMKCNLFLMLMMINILIFIIEYISGVEVFYIVIFIVNCDMFFCLLFFFLVYIYLKL